MPSNQPHPNILTQLFRAPNHKVKEMAKVAKTSSSCCQSPRGPRALKIILHPPSNQCFFLENRYNETVWVIVWGVRLYATDHCKLKNFCMLIYIYIYCLNNMHGCMGEIFKPQCFGHIFKWFPPLVFQPLGLLEGFLSGLRKTMIHQNMQAVEILPWYVI